MHICNSMGYTQERNSKFQDPESFIADNKHICTPQESLSLLYWIISKSDLCSAIF